MAFHPVSPSPSVVVLYKWFQNFGSISPPFFWWGWVCICICIGPLIFLLTRTLPAGGCSRFRIGIQRSPHPSTRTSRWGNKLPKRRASADLWGTLDGAMGRDEDRDKIWDGNIMEGDRGSGLGSNGVPSRPPAHRVEEINCRRFQNNYPLICGARSIGQWGGKRIEVRYEIWEIVD